MTTLSRSRITSLSIFSIYTNFEKIKPINLAICFKVLAFLQFNKCHRVQNHPIAKKLCPLSIKVGTHTQIMIFVTNLTTFAQSTFQVGLRNFYKSAIINWKITRTTSKLAQVVYIFKIQINQIFFEFQSFFEYSVVGTDTVTACCCQPFLFKNII